MQGEINTEKQFSDSLLQEYDAQSDDKQRVTWLVTYAKQLIVE